MLGIANSLTLVNYALNRDSLTNKGQFLTYLPLQGNGIRTRQNNDIVGFAVHLRSLQLIKCPVEINSSTSMCMYVANVNKRKQKHQVHGPVKKKVVSFLVAVCFLLFFTDDILHFNALQLCVCILCNVKRGQTKR